MKAVLAWVASALLAGVSVAQGAQQGSITSNGAAAQSSAGAQATKPIAQNAQPKPPLSPPGSAEVTLGGKTVKVDYGRPYLKGRNLGGPEIVPWGKVWRTGANEATNFVTDVDLDVNGTHVPAGKYTLYTLPEDKDHWKLIINKETGQWGTVYHEEQDLARIDMNVTQLNSPVEQLTISFDKKSESEAVMKIEWENTSAAVTIKTGEMLGDRVRASSSKPDGVGNQVDIISDTLGVDFRPYIERLLHDVRASWYGVIPKSARPPESRKGQVAIRFAIKRDGKLSDLAVEKSSGDTELDQEALTGISVAAPFPALPREFRGTELVLRFRFYYNPNRA